MGWIADILVVFGGAALAILEFKDGLQRPSDKWKFYIALLICLAGLYTALQLQGLVCKYRGEAAYGRKDYRSAAEHLAYAEGTFWANLESGIPLANSLKNLGASSDQKHAEENYYRKAMEVCDKLKTNYPKEIEIDNIYINLLRRLGEWDQLDNSIVGFKAKLETACGPDMRKESGKKDDCARYYVTLGNAYTGKYADQENDGAGKKREWLQSAVDNYMEAKIHNPANAYLLSNMPPRLIDLSRTLKDDAERKKALDEALEITKSFSRQNLDSELKQWLTVNFVDIYAEMLLPSNAALFDAAALKEELKTKASDLDKMAFKGDVGHPEFFYILSRAYIELGDEEKARSKFFHGTKSFAIFTDEQKKMCRELAEKLKETGACGL